MKTVAKSYSFPKVDQGHPYIPHLWAMRRVARLLEKESLKGAAPNLRDQIVMLAREFGFRLPATSATPTGHFSQPHKDAGGLLWSYKMSPVVEDVESDQYRTIEGKVFRLDKGLWVDTDYRDSMPARKVRFLSDEYFSLLGNDPLMGQYLALGPDLILVSDKGPIRIISDLSVSP